MSELWDEIELKAKELQLTGVDVEVRRGLHEVVFRDGDVTAVWIRLYHNSWKLRIFFPALDYFDVAGTTDAEMLDKILSPKEDQDFQQEMEDRILEAHEKWVQAEARPRHQWAKDIQSYKAVEVVLGKTPDRDDL